MYQKLVTYEQCRALNDSHHESCPSAAVFSLQHKEPPPSATSLLPSKLSSSADYLKTISSLFSIVNSKDPGNHIPLSSMTGTYPLFYCDTTPDDTSVIIQDEDGLHHYGVYVNDSLMGTWTLQKETNVCLSSFFQMIDGNKTVITGTMILFSEKLVVFDEAFGTVSYPCVTKDECLDAIQVDNKWYMFVDGGIQESSKMANVKTCIYQ